MTKEITKAIILQEIQDKLGLRDLYPEVFSFEESVVPTYGIEPHLGRWVTQYSEKSITETGAVVFFTVPDKQKWTMWRYDVIFVAAGAYTVAGLYTRRHDMPTTDFCYLDLGDAKSASYHVELPVPLVLAANDILAINVDGYTSTAALRVYLDYMQEEVR